MQNPFFNSRDPRAALAGNLGTITIPDRGKTTSEEIMIRHVQKVTIARRAAFRTLALVGAVTSIVTAGCGGGSSDTSTNTSTSTSTNTDAAPVLPDAAPDLGKDTVVPSPDMPPNSGPEATLPAIEVGPDIAADHLVPPPDAPDAPPVEADGAVDMPPAPMDGGVDGGGSCPSAVNAWSYPLAGTAGLDSVAWDSDGTLLTGATFYPFPIPGSAGTTPTGTIGGKSVTNKGSADVLVAKLDPSTGNANWVLTAGDGSDQYFTRVIPVGTTVVANGTFKGTIALGPAHGAIPPIVNAAATPIDFLIGLKDSDGSALWSESIDLGGGEVPALAANPGQSYFLVCGHATNDASDLGAVGTPGGGADVVVAAVKASDGTVVWAKLFGSAMDQKCLSAALDDNGNAYFAGTYAGSLDFGGGALPVPTASAVDGGTLSAAPAIAWVAKFKGADGTFLAAKSFGTTGTVAPSTLSLDPQGALLMAGEFNSDVTFGTQLFSASDGAKNGGSDGFVAKLDSSYFAPVWARSLDAGKQPLDAVSCNGIAADSAGNVTVAGQFNPSVVVGPGSTVLQKRSAGGEMFVATLSGASGVTLCAKNFGDPSSVGNGINGIAVNSRATGANKDRTVIAGWFGDVINFGGTSTALSSGSPTYGTKQGFLLEM